MSLSPTAKNHLCTILAALVYGGGVRPEDEAATTAALDGLKAELATDEKDIADLKGRVDALEDLDNGLEGAAAGSGNSATGSTVETTAGTAGTDAVTTTATTVDSAVGQTGADAVTTASIAPQAL